LPEENRAELAKIKPSLKEGVDFFFVKHVDQVLSKIFKVDYIRKTYRGDIQVVGSS
jgi:ATP-dependent Lon protease